MKISRGSALLVNQIKRGGSSWYEIAPTPLRKLLKQEEGRRADKIERVHFQNGGDFLISELRPKGRKNGRT